MKRIYVLLCTVILALTSCVSKSDDVIIDLPKYDRQIINIGESLDFCGGMFCDDSAVYVYGDNYIDEVSFITVDINTGDNEKKLVSGDYIYEPYNLFNSDIYSCGYRYEPETDTLYNRMNKDGWENVVNTYVDSSGTVYKIGYNSKGASVSVSDTDGDAVKMKSLAEITNKNDEELFVQDVIASENNIIVTYYEMEIIGDFKEYISYVCILDSNLNLIKSEEVTELLKICEISDGGENNIFLYSDDDETSTVIRFNYDTLEYSSPVVLDGKIRIFDGENPETVIYYDYDNKTLNTLNIKNGDQNEIYAVPQEYEFVYFRDSHVLMKENSEDLRTDVIKISDDLSVSKDSEHMVSNAVYDEISHKMQFYYDNKFLFENDCADDYSCYCSEKVFIMTDEKTADLYDIQGNLKNQISFTDKFNVKFLINKSKMSCVYEENNKKYYSEFDAESPEFTNTICLNELNCNVCNGEEVLWAGDSKNDFYVMSGDIVYAYSSDEKQLIPLLNASDEALSIKEIVSFGESVYVLSSDCSSLYVFKESEASETENAEAETAESEIPVIRISASVCADIAEELAAETGKFKVEKIYTEAKEKDYEFKIYTEDIPDILVTTSIEDYSTFERAGAFEDLSAFIDKEAYMDNVIEAFSVNGGLYRLPLKYYFWTWITSDDTLTDGKVWNYNTFKDVCAGHNSPELFASSSRYAVADNFLLFDNSDFISMQTRKNNYNSEEFITLLNAIDIYGTDDDSDVFNASPLIEVIKGFGPDDLENYGGKRIIGIPSAAGGESWIFSTVNIALSSKSDNKELCIEILKRILQDDNLDKIDENYLGFSVRKKDVESKLEKLDIRTDPVYAEDCRKMLFSSDKETGTSLMLHETVEEELAAFFSGEQSAEMTAEIMERKVNLYLDEIN